VVAEVLRLVVDHRQRSAVPSASRRGRNPSQTEDSMESASDLWISNSSSALSFWLKVPTVAK
jgi:hypothetical protein